MKTAKRGEKKSICGCMHGYALLVTSSREYSANTYKKDQFTGDGKKEVAQ